MTSLMVRHAPTAGSHETGLRSSAPVAWCAAAAALFFAVPWVGTDGLGLQPDLCYLGYSTVAVAFLATSLARAPA